MQTSVIHSLYIHSCSILYLQRTVMNATVSWSVLQSDHIQLHSYLFDRQYRLIGLCILILPWRESTCTSWTLKKTQLSWAHSSSPRQECKFKKKKIGFVRLFILNIFNYCCFKFHSQHIRRISFLAYLNIILKRFFSCVCQNPKIKFNGYSYTYT